VRAQDQGARRRERHEEEAAQVTYWMSKCDPEVFVDAAKKALGFADFSNITPFIAKPEHRALFKKALSEGTHIERATVAMMFLYPRGAKGSAGSASLRLSGLLQMLHDGGLDRRDFLLEEDAFLAAAATAPYDMHQHEFHRTRWRLQIALEKERRRRA